MVNEQAHEAQQKREVASRLQTRFRARSHATIPHGPTAPIHAAMCAAAANCPLTEKILPIVSTFTPCFITVFYYLNLMDNLMASTKRWTDNCMGWVPPCSQIYIGILCYIQTMRAMDAAGKLLPGSELLILLRELCTKIPIENLWIPGPLVAAFKSVACFRPFASGTFANVTPALPTTPGWSRERNYHLNDTATSHLPNIHLFISRLNSICAAATRPNINEGLFLSDVDGPRYLASLFGQPCNHGAKELAILTSPGASLTYAGGLKMWLDANSQLLFLGLPPTLDANATAVADSWTSFLGLTNDTSWFGSIAAVMAKYCQFWKGSAPLYDCSASSSAAGAVHCITTETNVFTPPTWVEQTGTHTNSQHENQNQVGHYTMRPSLTLTFESATSIDDIPINHIYAAHTIILIWLLQMLLWLLFAKRRLLDDSPRCHLYTWDPDLS